eukprot:GHVR01041919.1.p1 GENE.GHVR01041919.1~~GHVR01041919.1.p1  ORF type:complete len:205 (+),score=61.08 GHVR01041919.1:346-960(+)
MSNMNMNQFDKSFTTKTGVFVRPKTMVLPSKDEQCRHDSPSGRPGACVDEICTCLKHQCVKKTWRPNPVPFDGNTMYRQEFDSKPLPDRLPPSKPREYIPTKFEGETTNHADYKPWEHERQPPYKPQRGAQQPVPFEGLYTYTHTHTYMFRIQNSFRHTHTHKRTYTHIYIYIHTHIDLLHITFSSFIFTFYFTFYLLYYLFIL